MGSYSVIDSITKSMIFTTDRNKPLGSKSMKFTLIAMTLNEIQAMKIIMPRIDPDWFDQILVVDGGSTDGTVEWARENGLQVYVQKEPGIRNGYLEAWPLVEGDVVVTFSPDGNSIPEKLPEIIEKMKEGYDMVVASRYLGDAKSDDDDFITGFGNWLFTNTVNLLFGGKYTDVMVIYRAFDVNLIRYLDLDKDNDFIWPEKLFFNPARTISWEPILSVLAQKYGYKCGEISASEPPRIGGERKLKIIQWGGAVYLQFWLEFLRFKKPRRLRENCIKNI